MPLKVKRCASPPIAFYKLICCACDQIFGTQWVHTYVGMWHMHIIPESKRNCSLCGSQQVKYQRINKTEYETLEKIWQLEDLQFNIPTIDDDDDIPVCDLSHLE